MNIEELNSKYQGDGASVFYRTENTHPDAMIILNRGTEFESDVTSDLVSFNTSNSIDSITGNFFVNLDNNNDHLVNRFNFSKIKKMSSIEIFAKPIGGEGGADAGDGAQSIMVPEKIDDKATTMDAIINQTYGKQISQSRRSAIKEKIKELNAKRSAPRTVYKINKQNAAGKGVSVTFSQSGGAGLDDKFVDAKIASNEFIFEFRDGSVTTMKLKSGSSVSRDEFNLTFEASDIDYFKYTKVSKRNNLGEPEEFEEDKNDIPKNKIPNTFQDFTTTKAISKNVGLPDADKAFSDDQRIAPLIMPLPSNLYQRIFFGVVLNLNHNTSPGSGMVLTLSGKGVGYWLESSQLNLNPGGYEQTFTGIDLQVFANRFAESKALDIFRELISLSTGDLPSIVNANLSNLATSAEMMAVIGDEDVRNNFSDLHDNTLKKQNTDDGQAQQATKGGESKPVVVRFQSVELSRQIEEVALKRENIYRGISVQSNMDNPTLSSARGSRTWLKLGKKYNTNRKDIAKARVEIEKIDSALKRSIMISSTTQNDKTLRSKADKDTKVQTKKIEKWEKENSDLAKEIRNNDDAILDFKSLNKTEEGLKKRFQEAVSIGGRKKLLSTFGIIKHWKRIFSQMILEVMDNDAFLTNVFPFNYLMKEPQPSLDGDYISKAALGQQIAEFMQYEFYFDTNGHFVLKPPLYHLNLEGDSSLTDIYTVDDDDVISFSCNDTVEGILTRIGVAGDFRESPGVPKVMLQNIFQDFRLIRDYGFHAREITNLYFVKNTDDARDFGQAYMARNNMNLFNASITIQGRPNIRLGTPIYFKPRDTVYYLREIAHEFSVGGEYKTTLTVTGGRRVLTGFKSKLKVNDFQIKIVPDSQNPGQEKQVTVPIRDSEGNLKQWDVSHYLLSDGFNFESVAIDSINRGTDVDIGGSGTSSQTQTIDGKKYDLEDIGIGKGITDKVMILTNKYVITNHPNSVIIGLIVDKDSDVISDINLTNYKYFSEKIEEYGAKDPKNMPRVEGELDFFPQKKREAIKIISNAFTNYVKQRIDPRVSKASQLPDNVARVSFSIDRRKDFIKVFLKEVQSLILSSEGEITGMDLLGDANGNVIIGGESGKLKYRDAAVMFNSLVSKIDNNGLYKQVTDDQGRELPAYQDYGQGMIISQSLATADQFSQTSDVLKSREKQRASEVQKNRDEIAAKRANSLSGIHSTDGKIFKGLLDYNFSKYNIIPDEGDAKNEGKSLKQQQRERSVQAIEPNN